MFTVGGIAQKYNCALRRLDWQQEQGFVSSLALGYNEVEIQRGMTTSSTAIFIPFMTRELALCGKALAGARRTQIHHGIAGRLVPVPRRLSAGCGIAWRMEAEVYAQYQTVIADCGIEIEQSEAFVF